MQYLRMDPVQLLEGFPRDPVLCPFNNNIIPVISKQLYTYSRRKVVVLSYFGTQTI